VSKNLVGACFVLLIDRGEFVLGGIWVLGGFDPVCGGVWGRAPHTPPGRGIFRTIAAIAARAASLYFRYGGTAVTAFRGVQIARIVAGLSWSGLGARSSITNLQTLATASHRPNYPGRQLKRYGILDRVDPSRQLDRLSHFLWHRDRLAALRGQWMYFYTDLDTRDGNGLAGVNVNNGRTEREVRLPDLDERFITDEALGLMFTASGNRLSGHALR
jgi:hypothetical protein